MLGGVLGLPVHGDGVDIGALLGEAEVGLGAVVVILQIAAVIGVVELHAAVGGKGVGQPVRGGLIGGGVDVLDPVLPGGAGDVVDLAGAGLPLAAEGVGLGGVGEGAVVDALALGDAVAVDGDGHLVFQHVDLGVDEGAVQGQLPGLVDDEILAVGELGGAADLDVAAVLALHRQLIEGIEGVEGIVAQGVVAAAGSEGLGLAQHVGGLGGGPAQEGIALVGRGGLGQDRDLAGHAGGSAHGLPVGQIGQGDGSLPGEVDGDGAVHAGLDVEGVAVLAHGGAARGDGAAGGVVPLGGDGGDRPALGGVNAHGDAALALVLGDGGEGVGIVAGVGLDAEVSGAVLGLAPAVHGAGDAEEGGVFVDGMGVGQGGALILVGAGGVDGQHHHERAGGLAAVEGEDGGELLAAVDADGGVQIDGVIAVVGNGAGLGAHEGAGGGICVVGEALVDVQGVAQALLQGQDGDGLHLLMALGGEHVGDLGVVGGEAHVVVDVQGAVVLVDVLMLVHGLRLEEHTGLIEGGGVLVGDVVVAVLGVGGVAAGGAPGVLDDPGAVGGGAGALQEVVSGVAVVPAHQGDAVVGAVLVGAVVGPLLDAAIGAGGVGGVVGGVEVVAEEGGAVLQQSPLHGVPVGGGDPVHVGDVGHVVIIGVLGVDGCAYAGLVVGQGGKLLAGGSLPAHQGQGGLVAVAADVQVGLAEHGAVPGGEAVLVIGIGVGEVGQMVLGQIQVGGGCLSADAHRDAVLDHIGLDGGHGAEGPAGAVGSLVLDGGVPALLRGVVVAGQAVVCVGPIRGGAVIPRQLHMVEAGKGKLRLRVLFLNLSRGRKNCGQQAQEQGQGQQQGEGSAKMLAHCFFSFLLFCDRLLDASAHQ